MSGVMQKLAGMRGSVVLAVALTVSGGAAWAGPYSLAQDGDKVWVLDAKSGELTVCQQVTPSGPKVIDMVGGFGQARPGTPRTPKPACAVALDGAPDEVGARFGRVGLNGYADYGMSFVGAGSGGYWGYAPLSGVSGGAGNAAVAVADGQVVIVRPRTVNVFSY